jgi:hypothetical protein
LANSLKFKLQESSTIAASHCMQPPSRFTFLILQGIQTSAELR